MSGLLLLTLLGGCEATEEVDWVRFNSDDTLEVQVVDSEELGDAVEADLYSTTGAVVVGQASVDPGSGPVGTDHLVTVEVLDAWQDMVGLVTVQTDSGERGVEEHELVQDSADHGMWIRTLTSAGAEGEERTDTFTVLLWAEDPDAEAADTAG